MAAPTNPFVPIRVVAKAPNVVPVETVGAPGTGIVPVRVIAGTANIVPVYETAVDTPRVLVVLV